MLSREGKVTESSLSVPAGTAVTVELFQSYAKKIDACTCITSYGTKSSKMVVFLREPRFCLSMDSPSKKQYLDRGYSAKVLARPNSSSISC